MKLKKFKFKQILKLYLLNSRAYEYAVKKTNSGLLTDFSLIQIISDFKKALHIIFEYHQAQKKILFVGVPKKLELKINKLTHHVAVDHNFELQGVISNNFKPSNLVKVGKQSFSKVYFKSLIPKLSKKPDLVVLLSHEKPQNIIAESKVAKVPVITFISDSNANPNLIQGSYNLEGFGQNLISTSEKSLFFLGLNFLFKRFKTPVRNSKRLS
jgi:ribosomal protein S2